MRRWLINLYLTLIALFTVVLILAMWFDTDKHTFNPLLLLVPALMLADYYLTLASARLAKCINPTIDVASLELNPIWKADVAKFRRLNIRHMLIVVYAFVVLYMLSQAPVGPWRSFYLGCFGFYIGSSGGLVSQHLLHISWYLKFLRTERNKFRVRRSTWGAKHLGELTFLVLLVLSSACLPGSFVIGGIAGLLLEMILGQRLGWKMSCGC